MVKRTLIMLPVFMFITSMSYSQEIKYSCSLTGPGWIKIAHSKKSATFRFYDVSYEKQFLTSWGWSAGLGISHLQYDGITDGTVEYFRERAFVTFPVSIRKYYQFSRQSMIYMECGVIIKYELSDKIDFNSLTKTDEKFKGGGYLMDVSAFAGFKTWFRKGYALDIGFGDQQNVFASYKKNENTIKPTASFLTLSFSKKLQQFKKIKK